MSNVEDLEAARQIIDANPFEGMLIQDDTFLSELEGRYPCPKCFKSRKFFCYSCYVPISELKGLLPVVKVSLEIILHFNLIILASCKIDIIKHKHEIDGKSTAAHAAVLAPDDVRVFTYPDLPNYNSDNVVLIFPSFNAIRVNQLFENGTCGESTTSTELPKGFNRTTLMTKKADYKGSTCSSYSFSNNLSFDRAVFIDSTWNQSKGIFKDSRINQLRCVVLQNRISQFWRHQTGSPRWYLSTIEAIHQFSLEIHLSIWGLNVEYKGLRNCGFEKVNRNNSITSYNGEYDNLLLFFKHMYKLIHTYYDHDKLYAYKRRLL